MSELTKKKHSIWYHGSKKRDSWSSRPDNYVYPNHITDDSNYDGILSGFTWTDFLGEFDRGDQATNSRKKISKSIVNLAFFTYIKAIIKDVLNDNVEFHFTRYPDFKVFITLRIGDRGNQYDNPEWRAKKKFHDYLFWIETRSIIFRKIWMNCVLEPSLKDKKRLWELWMKGHTWEKIDVPIKDKKII